MDLDRYLLDELVEARISELHADAARMEWPGLASVDAPGPSRSLGAWLIESARWLINAPRHSHASSLRAAPDGANASRAR
jgi:hypothetical protein